MIPLGAILKLKDQRFNKKIKKSQLANIIIFNQRLSRDYDFF